MSSRASIQDNSPVNDPAALKVPSHSWRTGARAFLIALACALPFLVVPRDGYVFELTLKSDKDGAMVFYPDLGGRGFTDEDQATRTLRAGVEPQVYRFSLPDGDYRGFRFLCIENLGALTVSSLKITDTDGRLVHRFSPALLHIADQPVPTAVQSLPDRFEVNPKVNPTNPNLELLLDKPVTLAAAYDIVGRARGALPVFFGAFFAGWAMLVFIGRKFGGVESLFGNGPAGPGARSPIGIGRFLPWLTVLAAGLVFFARMPDRLLNPQFYAEDGYFYACAVEFGGKAFLMPYGGYLLTIDRLIAWPAIHVPARWAPLFFNATALLFALLVIGKIFSARIKLPCKPLLALTVVFIPRPQDIFLTVTNLQWVLALGLILVLISTEPTTVWQRLRDFTWALVSGLSGVYSALFLPFFLWRAIRRKTRSSVALAGVIGATAAVQMWLVVHAPHGADDPMPYEAVLIPRIVGLRLFCLLFGGPWLVHPPVSLLVLVAVVCVGWAVFICATPSRSLPEPALRWVLLGVAGVLAAAAIYRFKAIMPLFLRSGYSRYFFLTQILFIWLIVTELSAGRVRRYLAIVALYAFVVTTLCTFRLEPFVDHRWNDYAPLIERHQRAYIPINPPGWSFLYPGAPK